MPVLAQIKKTSSPEELYYFFNDDLGSKRVVLNSSGGVVEKIKYSAFGELKSGGRESALFTGKQLDATGLYYFNARYYDPITKRFITQDPSKQGSGWYTYCNNNPINLVDPDGKETSKITIRFTHPKTGYSMYAEYDEIGKGWRMWVIDGNGNKQSETMWSYNLPPGIKSNPVGLPEDPNKGEDKNEDPMPAEKIREDAKEQKTETKPPAGGGEGPRPPADSPKEKKKEESKPITRRKSDPGGSVNVKKGSGESDIMWLNPISGRLETLEDPCSIPAGSTIVVPKGTSAYIDMPGKGRDIRIDGGTGGVIIVLPMGSGSGKITSTPLSKGQNLLEKNDYDLSTSTTSGLRGAGDE